MRFINSQASVLARARITNPRQRDKETKTNKIMKNFILRIVVFALFFSCATKSQVKLMDDENVRKIFNKEEIESLTLIVGFFDGVIVEGAATQDINDEYQRFFNVVNEAESFEDLKTNIGLANSAEVKELMWQLKDVEFFDEIWKYEYGYDYRTKDTISIRLTLNMQGKYFKLLELLGARNEYLKEYVNTTQTAGTIPPSLIAGILRAYNNFDFHKEINRLVWAVHYITILSEKEYE